MPQRILAITMGWAAWVPVAGCTSETSCELRAGQYEATFTELSGDCGNPYEDPVSIAVSQGAYPFLGGGSACDLDGEVTDDNCVATATSRCSQEGFTASISSTVEFVSETEAKSIAEVTITEDSTGDFCSSRYRIRWRRL